MIILTAVRVILFFAFLKPATTFPEFSLKTSGNIVDMLEYLPPDWPESNERDVENPKNRRNLEGVRDSLKTRSMSPGSCESRGFSG